jgi:hypothetical protein
MIPKELKSQLARLAKGFQMLLVSPLLNTMPPESSTSLDLS